MKYAAQILWIVIAVIAMSIASAVFLVSQIASCFRGHEKGI